MIAHSEVTDINRQKFLAELAKLLTFMYEEDRQEALAMYAAMFDEAEDEQALLQALVSPTRQAVVIARAYNAKERKLQVYAQSREEADEGSDADFVRVINQVRSDALSEQLIKPAVDENQFCLFDDLSAESDSLTPPENDTATAEPVEVPEQATETVYEAPAAAEEEQPAEPVSVEEESPADTAPEQENKPSSSEREALPLDETATADDAEEAVNVPGEVLDEVDAFLADFSLPDDVLGLQKEPAAQEEEFIQGELTQVTEVEEEEEKLRFSVPETVRKPKIFLLILYIILAIPITLAGIVLLLIPTLLFLLLAAGTISGGVLIFSASFSGFVVFADMMVVLGTAIIVLALGLLCLWTFIWFIGGAIVGLVRSVIELGETWCYKEVPAE